MIALLVLVACRADPAGPGDTSAASVGDTSATDTSVADTSASTDTSAHLDTSSDWSAPDPSYSAEEVGAHLATIASYGLPDPGTLLTWFDHIVEIGGVEGCPNLMNGSMNAGIGGCLASTQYTFAGILTIAPADGAAVGTTDDYEVDGDGYVDDPQHNVFQLTGKIIQAVDASAWSLEFEGTWGYPLADGWLRGVPSSALLLTGDGDAVTIDGGYGIGDDAAYFHDVIVASDGASTGEVRLRDPAGSWYTLTLGGGADGCGDVTYDGVSLGAACVDVAALAWDVAGRVAP